MSTSAAITATAAAMSFAAPVVVVLRSTIAPATHHLPENSGEPAYFAAAGHTTSYGTGKSPAAAVALATISAGWLLAVAADTACTAGHLVHLVRRLPEGHAGQGSRPCAGQGSRPRSRLG